MCSQILNHYIGEVNGVICMKTSAGRAASKSKFSPAEDRHLKDVIESFGCEDWGQVASYMPDRNSRQCRERWNNYVNPAIMKMPWIPHEENLLDQKFAEFGPKWKEIAKFFPNRSKNYVKNHWMTKQRRIRKMTEKREGLAQKRRIQKDEPAPRVVDDKNIMESFFPDSEYDPELWAAVAAEFLI
jgi:hypothetical protein